MTNLDIKNSSAHFISVENASFSYNAERVIFQNANLNIDKGEVLTILGPNGAGKSTLLNCIGNVKKLTAGKITICGKENSKYTASEIAQKISYVPQMQSRVYDFIVRDYIAMGRAPHIGMFNKPSAKDYARVDEVIKELGIENLQHKPYTILSGGECQQVLIARALVQEAEVIIMDEPTNHLDYGNQIKVLKQIKKLSNQGYGVVWTTHMPDHALLMGGKVAVLDYDGNLQVGTCENLLTEENLRRLYDTDICKTYVEQVDRDACLAYSL